MKIIFKFIITITFITFSFSLYAGCDAPNFDNCKIDDEEKVLVIENNENVNISNNSNMKIGSMIFTSDNLNLDMSKSTLDTNRLIPSNSSYKINLTLDESFFTFRNASSITIDNLTFTGSTDSTFSVLGLSNVYINNLESNNNAIVKVKSSFSTLNLTKATIKDLYLTTGYLRIKGGEDPNDTTSINNILNEDPEDNNTKDYTDLNKGGYIEISSKGILNVNKVDASSVHVVSGTLNIAGEYNIYTLDNKNSSNTSNDDDKIININSTSSGMITTINLGSLNLEGQMTIQNGGIITSLNYIKDSNGNLVGTPQGTLEYLGEKIPDKDGNIDENSPAPTLTLANTYLDNLFLHGGDIKITKDSIINNITNPTEKGNLRIEYVNNMQSNTVDITNLDLYATNYTVSSSFNAKNLKMGAASVLTLDSATPLTFDSLELNSYSKIQNSGGGFLDININKNLSIANSMLNVNNLTFTALGEVGVLQIAVDNNLIDGSNSKFSSGVSATGNIELNNVNILANIQDTSLFNLKRAYSYKVLHADNGFIIDGSLGNPKDIYGNGSTNLPEWFSSDFYLSSDGKDLLVDVKRNKSYQELLASSAYSGDKSTINIAKVLDNMVDNASFTNNLAEVIKRIDLKSDINSIGSNLASLKPVSNNVYINDIHTTADIYLDMLSQNSSYSYLKTKDSQSDILWVRNGFKTGKTVDANFYTGNDINTYFVMSGFDILAFDLAKSYFQLGVAGGVNFSDIKARDSLYDISASGFNVSMYANFIAEKFSVSFNSMYINNIYDTTRLPLDNKITSNNNVAEIVNNLEVATRFNLDGNILLKPSIFYTSGYIMAGNTSEQGAAGYNLASYSTVVNDIGLAALFYTDFNDLLFKTESLQGSYAPYVEVKSFYRTYDVPNTSINFLNTNGYNIDIIGNQENSMVVKGSLGVDYEKNAMVLGIKYSYEHSFNNYSNNQFYLNYKLLLN